MNPFPTICFLTDLEIDLNQIVQEITLPTTGAVVVFTGMVRAETVRTDRKTDYLEYEAYEPMALEKLKQVTRLGRVSPIAWQHINFHGRFEFLDPPAPIDLELVVQELAQGSVDTCEDLD